MTKNMQLSSLLTTARDILKENKNRPMHVNEISELATKSARNQAMTVEDFSTKLAGALASHLKLKTQKPIFTKPLNKKGRPQKGIYRLKQEKTTPIAAMVEAPSVSNAFVGCAGEYAVMSELLFWGHNVSLMSVDDGIDIVTHKENRYFHVQVKTATSQNNGRFSFSIKRHIFEAHDKSDTFYVFVMRKKLACDYAILPSNHIRTLIGAGQIASSPTLSVFITTDERGREFKLCGDHNINLFINNFGIIR